MTARDYRAVAALLSEVGSKAEHDQEHGDAAPPTTYVNEIIDRLADVFAADNERFDRERFLAAAYA